MNRETSEVPEAGALQGANGGSNPKDTVQRVTDGLIYSIRSGQMVPGQHLVESDLTRHFGVSRGSLREGLKQLSSMGIVTLTRYRGAFISALDRKSVSDLLEILEPLCVLAARLAAQNCRSDEAKAELKQIATDLGRLAEAGGRAHYLENRRLFYDKLIAMGGNTELGEIIPLTRTDLFRAQFDRVQTKEHQRKHANGYLKIAESVMGNDPAKAERATRSHFASTRRTLDTLPDHAFASLG